MVSQYIVIAEDEETNDQDQWPVSALEGVSSLHGISSREGGPTY
jgi:hypothetical protein